MTRPGDLLVTERTPRVVAARKLQRRRERDAAGRFLVEGPQAVREALAASAVVELFCSRAAAVRHPDLLAAHSRVTAATDKAIDALAETEHAQGLVAVCRKVDRPFAQALAPGARLVCVLADIRDPGNAGTVLRSADAAGADSVIFAGDSVDPHNGKAVRASAGSVFHLPVARRVSVAEAVAGCRSARLRILAADANGAVNLDDADLRGPAAWLFGNEAAGLTDAVADLADEVVRIPIYGCAESLNLAAAATLCLYATARAQRAGER
jgi:TrmH family RNA methyltransferase